MGNQIIHRRKYPYKGKDKQLGEYTTYCKARALGYEATADIAYLSCPDCIRESIIDFEAKAQMLRNMITKGKPNEV